MLTDPAEIKIIQGAKQKNVRDPQRSRAHFENILSDFFQGVRLNGHYLDLGPGQYDFGELARLHGGTSMGVDFDPAVLELGRYKGFETLELNLKALPQAHFDQTFDGVWNKFALNAYWTGYNEDAQKEMANAINKLVVEEGWAWIAPWNGVPKSSDLNEGQLSEILEMQKTAFEDLGFQSTLLTVGQAKKYGVNGTVGNNIIFTKNLKPALLG
ncbi:MAG: class I SAM-dependent methyltransferase [Pseudomonadota bacterium]